MLISLPISLCEPLLGQLRIHVNFAHVFVGGPAHLPPHDLMTTPRRPWGGWEILPVLPGQVRNS